MVWRHELHAAAETREMSKRLKQLDHHASVGGRRAYGAAWPRRGHGSRYGVTILPPACASGSTLAWRKRRPWTVTSSSVYHGAGR